MKWHKFLGRFHMHPNKTHTGALEEVYDQNQKAQQYSAAIEISLNIQICNAMLYNAIISRVINRFSGCKVEPRYRRTWAIIHIQSEAYACKIH